jgi:hypothetical protein
MSAVVLFNAEGLIHFAIDCVPFILLLSPKLTIAEHQPEKVALELFIFPTPTSRAPCVAGDGCGLCLRAFPVRFRAGVEAGAGEANLVRVLFGCGREGDW